jgi:hypothetical protein
MRRTSRQDSRRPNLASSEPNDAEGWAVDLAMIAARIIRHLQQRTASDTAPDEVT